MTVKMFVSGSARLSTVTQHAHALMPGGRAMFVVPLLVAAILSGGCDSPAHIKPEKTAEELPPEPPLAEQAEAVRSGKIHKVRLDHTLVTDHDLDLLDGLQDNVGSIIFSRSEITDEGLAKIARMTELEQLRLASPKVTDAGMASVASLAHLRFLHLLHAPITDAGLDQLHGLKTLESLYLDNTKVTDDGIARLLKALPGVHLHMDDHHHPLDSQHQHEHENSK